MKRLIVMCIALALALAPAATAEAAKGGKSKGAAKTCAVKAKKASKGKNASKGKKSKTACGKKTKKAKKAAPTAAVTATAQKECRADRRLDPEGFAADFGTGADAVAKCTAELIAADQESGDDTLPEDEPLDDLPETDPLEDAAAPAPFDAADDHLGDDEELV